MATVTVHHHPSGGPADPSALVDGPTYDTDPHIVAGLENVPNVDTTNPVNINFLQTGTGASTINIDAFLRAAIVVPEMFGYSGSGDAGPAIQRAINSNAGAVTVIFRPNHTYVITTPVVVAKFGVSLLGGGDSTVLQFAPTSVGTAITWYSTLLPGGVYYGRFMNMRITSSDTTYVKTALNLIDVGDMDISGLVIGPAWTDTTNQSIGLKTNGRQCTPFRRLDIFADRPIVLAHNPNAVGISADHFHFTDLYLIANGNPCIEAETDVVFSNTTFDGYQSWVGGTYGFYYNGTAAPSRGYNLSFANVRTEGGASATAYSFYINATGGIATVSLTNCTLDTARKGIYGRSTLTVKLDAIYFPAVSSTEALNFNGSCDVVSIRASRWEAGCTQSMSGLTKISNCQAPAGLSAAVFPEALFVSGSSGLTLQTPFFSQSTVVDFVSFAGSGSGSTTFQASAAASGTITIPAATDTLVGKATTDALTNKTISGANNTLNVRIGADVSGLGTGVPTALGIAIGSAGALVTLNGAGGTPSAITLTNASGTAASLNSGTAATLTTARNIDGQSFNGSANITVIAPGTHAATGKTTPVDADEVPLVDSAASNVLKKLTWANLKATLKAYFDTLYAALDNSAWTAYNATLFSEAGGAIGTPTSTAGAWKALPGKAIAYRLAVVMGASGVGTATAISVSLPAAAAGPSLLSASNRTSGLSGRGDIGQVSLSRAILFTSTGGILGGNNDTMIISGIYEAA